MATKLRLRWLLSTSGPLNGAHYDWGSGVDTHPFLAGGTGRMRTGTLDPDLGSGVQTSSVAAVAGPTSGLELQVGSREMQFISAPIDADVTISGTIGVSLWGSEASMAINATLGVLIERIDSTGAVVSTIAQGIGASELGTSATQLTFNLTPTSTNMLKGDRIRAVMYADDAPSTTMAASGTINGRHGGSTADADGDTYINFNETFGFLSTTPTGSTIYLTNTASEVSTASVDREAWTSRGAGVQTDVTNTAAAPTSPIQITDTAGGTVVDWFTKELEAFTLGGAVLVNARCLESATAANVKITCEIAVVDSDGTNPVVWGQTGMYTEFPTTAEAARQFVVAGDDTSVANGKRLRLRFSIFNATYEAMAASQTATIYYAGTSGGASGDFYLIFSQTLTEYGGAQPIGALTLIDSGRDLYTPTVIPGAVTATLPLLDSGPTMYAPTVSNAAGGTQVLDDVPLIDSGRDLYAPAVVYTQGLTLGLMDSGPAVYAPTVSLSATKLFFVDSAADNYVSMPQLNTPNNYLIKEMSDSRVGSVTTAVSDAVQTGSGSYENVGSLFISPPLAEDTLLNGNLVAHFRMAESSNGLNRAAGISANVVHPDGSLTTIVSLSNYGSELTTSEATYEWSVNVSSVTAHKGDRIAVTVRQYAMAAKTADGTVTLWYAGANGATGDSWVEIPGGLVFDTDETPAGTQMFLTTTVSDVTPPHQFEVARVLSFARGSGAATGEKAGLGSVSVPSTTYQVTVLNEDLQILVWYTPPLAAVDLTGPIKVRFRAYRSSVVEANMMVALYKRTAAGVETKIAQGAPNLADITTSEATYEIVIPLHEVSLAENDRVALRLYLEDPATANAGASGSSTTLYVKYAGTAADATGDMWVTFNQTFSLVTQSLTLPLIDSGPTVYTPAVIQGATGDTLYLTLMDSGRAVYVPDGTTPVNAALTVEADDDTFTSAVPHGLSVGDMVRFNSITGGDGLTEGVTYFVAVDGLTATTFKVTAVAGGGLVNVTSDGAIAAFDWGYALGVNALPGPPGEEYPGSIDARYAGEAMAIHVISTTTSDTFSADPDGPDDLDSPLYTGTAAKIFAHPDAPPDWYSPGIVGPEIAYPSAPIYRGVSPAIHVFGEDRETTTYPPITGCDCGGECTFNEGFLTGSPEWELVLGNPDKIQITDSSLLQAAESPTSHVYELKIFEAINPTLFAQFVQTGLYFVIPFSITEPDNEQNSGMNMKFSFGWAGAPSGSASAGIGYYYDSIDQVFRRSTYVEWWNGITTEIAADIQESGGGFGTLSGNLTLQINATGYTVTSPYGTAWGDGIEDEASPPGTVAHDPSSATVYVVLDLTMSNRSGYNFGAVPQYEEIYWGVPQIYGEEFTPDWCSGSQAPCEECDDPNNPGFQIPDFTPGFMPTFRYQIGDPTTSLDSYICTLESGAMVLEWHTRGAVSVWGGELIPWCGKTEAEIVGVGTNLGNVRQAWSHWGQSLDIRSGDSWADLVVCLAEGRAVILQGDYGEFTDAESCQDNFNEPHAIAVFPYQVGDRLLVGDPLCDDYKGIKATSLQAYAEALGVAVYGATTPQKILFAVSRPWTP